MSCFVNYNSYYMSDPFGFVCSTFNTTRTTKYKGKRNSFDSIFHSFSFLNKNYNSNNINDNKKQKKNNKQEKNHTRALSSPSSLNCTPNTSNNVYSYPNYNDNINTTELTRCCNRYSDLIDYSQVYQPSITVEEKDTQYNVYIYLPDVRKEEIKVEKCNNNIIIYGERRRKSRRCDSFSKFNRMFSVPDDALINSLKIKYQNNVLEIVLLKK